MGKKAWLVAVTLILGCKDTVVMKPMGPGDSGRTDPPQNPGAFVCVPGTEPQIRAQAPLKDAGTAFFDGAFPLTVAVSLPWRFSTTPDTTASTVGQLAVELWPGWGLLFATDLLNLPVPSSFDLSLELPGHNDCGACANLIIGKGEEQRVFAPYRGTLTVTRLNDELGASLTGLAFREVGKDGKFLADGCRPILGDSTFSIAIPVLAF